MVVFKANDGGYPYGTKDIKVFQERIEKLEEVLFHLTGCIMEEFEFWEAGWPDWMPEELIDKMAEVMT